MEDVKRKELPYKIGSLLKDKEQKTIEEIKEALTYCSRWYFGTYGEVCASRQDQLNEHDLEFEIVELSGGKYALQCLLGLKGYKYD